MVYSGFLVSCISNHDVDDVCVLVDCKMNRSLLYSWAKSSIAPAGAVELSSREWISNRLPRSQVVAMGYHRILQL